MLRDVRSFKGGDKSLVFTYSACQDLLTSKSTVTDVFDPVASALFAL